MTSTATAGKTEELLQRLMEVVKTLTSSDEWVRYLDVQSRFYYSFGNCILIALQCPDASRRVQEVAGAGTACPPRAEGHRHPGSSRPSPEGRGRDNRRRAHHRRRAASLQGGAP